jgi:hypothetical protein
MNIKTAAATLGATLLIGSPAFVSAAPLAPSPVRLDNVQIFPDRDAVQTLAYPGAINIAFTNQTTVPVTTVVFDVEANGVVIDRITDAGKYLQNVTVKHSFPDQHRSADQKLTIESVTFADGSTWQNTDVAARRRQAPLQAP